MMTHPTKVLVCDPIAPAGIEMLSKAGLEVVNRNGLKEDGLIAIAPEFAGMIVRSETKITKKIIEAAKHLKVIGRAGVGVDNIDLEAATKQGIIVVNSPEGNTIAAAEHTLAMLLALSRNIPEAEASLRRGEWKRSAFTGVEVYGKTLGVLGLGKIGSRVAQFASAIGMRVLGYDPFVSAEYSKKLGVELRGIDDVLREADYLTLHLPKTKETTKILGKENMAKLKKGVRIINCARGGIIDEDALAEAIQSGHVAGAALDVFDKEPPDPKHPLLSMPQVVVTPHLGAATVEAQVNVALDVVSQVIDVLRGEPARSAVNIPSMRPELLLPVKPYLPLAEKLGKLATQLVYGGLQAVEVKYLGEVAAFDVSPLTVALLKGILEPLFQESVNFVNAPVIARERGIRVLESKSDQVTDFANLISVKVISSKVERTVEGTLFGSYGERLVRIDGYKVEAVPAGFMLIAGNQDQPGMIGKIGTFLGSHKINIAGMDVGRERIGGQAVMVINVDQDIPNGLVSEISKMPGINWATVVRL